MSEQERSVPHIHSETYLEEFEQARIDHHSLVATTNRSKESLNGQWHMTVDPYDTGLRTHWNNIEYTNYWEREIPWDYSWDEGDLVPIPSCWNMTNPELFYYEGSVWYARAFGYKQALADERVILRIGAANYDTKVFLNGEYLGNHSGGSTPFCVELTNHLKESNIIQLCVNNERSVEHLPGRNFDWFNYGGLYRDVELIRLPNSFIQDFFIYLVPDNCFSTIKASVQIDNPTNGIAHLEIPELAINQEIEIKEGLGEVAIKCQPELWSPTNPKLYKIKVSYEDDTIIDQVGFRQIETKGSRILLNGEDIFLRGISVHEDDVTLGKATSEEDIRRRFLDAKELGCNYVRLAHYPHSERAAQIADEVGMLLWEELPVYWTIAFSNPQTQQDANNQLTELIKRDRNRASVVFWSVGNENADTDDRLSFMVKLANTARKLDPSRLVAAACIMNQDRLAEHLDVIGLNEYYGWYIKDFDELGTLLTDWNPGKPVIISETGAGALAGNHGAKTQLFTEEYMAEVYRKQIGVIKTVDYIRGISPWILYDFRAGRRANKFQRGFNRKGLIAADKMTRKLAYYVLQEFYTTSFS